MPCSPRRPSARWVHPGRYDEQRGREHLPAHRLNCPVTSSSKWPQKDRTSVVRRCSSNWFWQRAEASIMPVTVQFTHLQVDPAVAGADLCSRSAHRRPAGVLPSLRDVASPSTSVRAHGYQPELPKDKAANAVVWLNGPRSLLSYYAWCPGPCLRLGHPIRRKWRTGAVHHIACQASCPLSLSILRWPRTV